MTVTRPSTDRGGRKSNAFNAVTTRLPSRPKFWLDFYINFTLVYNQWRPGRGHGVMGSDVSRILFRDTDLTRMWANAQRDGRPAEYR